MAEVSVSANYAVQKQDRFVRDCANPNAKPIHRAGPDISVLQVAAVCPQPDIVVVNGRRYSPEASA